MAASPLNVHLHCAQCDLQLGIFENEWVHLTPSYARPKERGINMGCRIGSRTQVVPQGPTQKEAAGCLMVELFCEKCSSIVGQSCKTAPTPEQQNLVNQRFFKLSRIYLTDVKDERREDPIFVDADNFDNPSRSTSVRSGVVPQQRAVSRGGLTPSFRQSYPPPSSQTSFYDQYHAPQNMPPPRQSFQQVPPSPVLVHYPPPPPPPPSNYPYSYPASRQQTDVPEPYQPVVANPVPELQQEVKGQGVSISECFNRIAAAERRLANDETRVSEAERRSIDVVERMQKSEAHTDSLRQRVEQLEKDSKSQSTTLIKNQDMQVASERLIATQAEQIASLTEKLETFQTTIEELKAQLENVRSRPLVQQNPRPDSHDFLENMEVMIKAMRSTQAREQEVESLREKNRAMKARLETIFAAMGSVPEEDTALLDDPSLRVESPILGKRKRASDVNEAEQRKLARRVSSIDARDQSLPTPESTQSGRQSSNESQAASTGSEDPLTLQEKVSQLDNNAQPQEVDNVMTDPKKDTTVISGETNIATILVDGKSAVNIESGSQELAETVRETSESRSTPADIHQAHAVNGHASYSVHQYDNQNAHHLQGSSKSRDFSVEPAASPHQSRPWSVSRNQHPALAYSRLGSANSVQNPGASASYFSNTSILPHSQAHSPLFSTCDSQTRSWKRDELSEEGTFSHALSRGHRLEDIIQRPSRPSSVYNSDNPPQNQAQARAETHDRTAAQMTSSFQPNQSSLLEAGNAMQQRNQARVNRNGAANETSNCQAIEFSDEENVRPTTEKSTATRGKQTVSTTPSGNPRPQPFDRATVARTIRELTQEPLRRPVIIDPSPGARVNMNRGATHAQQQPMLPSFATAIHNLNDSAARHVATTSPRPGENEAIMRGRVSDSVPPRPSANLNAEGKIVPREKSSVVPAKRSEHKASQFPFNSTLTPRTIREKGSAAPESRSEKKSPPTNSDAAQASHDSSLPKPRGRPRKSSTTTRTTTRTRASSNTPNSQNDDVCAICSRRGKLLCCDGCPKVYHHRCLHMDSKQPVEGDWFCPECTAERERQKASDTITVKPQHDDHVMAMRRKLAEEAMARDMAQKV